MRDDLLAWASALGVLLWLVFIGPLWLVGWGVLHSTKVLNRVAAVWCKALLALFPVERSP